MYLLIHSIYISIKGCSQYIPNCYTCSSSSQCNQCYAGYCLKSPNTCIGIFVPKIIYIRDHDIIMQFMLQFNKLYSMQ